MFPTLRITVDLTVGVGTVMCCYGQLLVVDPSSQKCLCLSFSVFAILDCNACDDLGTPWAEGRTSVSHGRGVLRWLVSSPAAVRRDGRGDVPNSGPPVVATAA